MAINAQPEPEKITIGLIGPCGSGKSTLAIAFSALPDVDVALEIPPKALESNPPYTSLNVMALQREFLQTRLRQATAARSKILVLDRTVEEDREVFLRLHYELGGITRAELAQLDEFAELTGALIGTPDAIVILKANPETLRLRIGNRARPDWIVASFDRQLSLYATLVAKTKGSVLEIDTTALSASTLRQIAPWIATTAPLAAMPTDPLESTNSELSWNVR